MKNKVVKISDNTYIRVDEVEYGTIIGTRFHFNPHTHEVETLPVRDSINNIISVLDMDDVFEVVRKYSHTLLKEMLRGVEV